MTQQTVKLFWIAGASTAGKTTILPLLKLKLPSEQFAVHDFDEVDIPAARNEKERKRAIRYWLRVAVKNAKKDISTVVGGAIFPAEIMAHDTILKELPVCICYLDVHQSVIAQRMTERFGNTAEREKWLASVGKELDDSIALTIRTAKRYRKEGTQYQVKVFNTSRTTPARAGRKISRWIISAVLE